jgi:modulator of FtsH protease
MTTAYLPDAWETFAAANAGAAAALAGLVFGGVSINVAQIVQSKRLVARGLEAFILLTMVLLVSVLILVPDISTTGLGIGLLVVGLVVELVVCRQISRTLPRFSGESSAPVPRGSDLIRITLGQAATLPVLVAGATLIAENGGGLYWLVGALAFAYVAALVNAWVLLIEILR